MKNTTLLSNTALAFLFALGACSGGGGGNDDPVSVTQPVAPLPSPPPPPPPPPPTSSKVSSSGIITGFGSVFINGVKYEVDETTVVSVEGEDETVGDDSGLAVGMRVYVSADDVDGVRTAGQIYYDEDLKGFVENVLPDQLNPLIGTFEVNGQVVTVDEQTLFDFDIGDNDSIPGIDIRDLDPSLLPVGQFMVVEVSGYPTETGIIATRIEREGDGRSDDYGHPSVDGDELEITGFVDSVDVASNTFAINSAIFSVNSATLFDDGLVFGPSLVGQFIEVKADRGSTDTMIARRVEIEGRFKDDDGTNSDRDGDFEIEGILHSVDLSADPDVIVVNGVTFSVSDASSLVGLVGQRVEIYGYYDANGIVQLRTYGTESQNSIKIEDRISSIDLTAGIITTRLGVQIEPTGASRISDDDSRDGSNLTVPEFMARLSVNDLIEAKGTPNGTGGVTWTRIERDNDDDRECSLRGPVVAGTISDPTFTILNVVIDTTGLSTNGFETANDSNLTRSQFFSQLLAGDLIDAESDERGLGCETGRLSTGSSGEVSFENGDGVSGNDDDDRYEDDYDDGNDDDDDGGYDDDDSNVGGQEISGAVRNLNAATRTFSVANRTVTATDDTLIDDSIVERARGVNLGSQDFRLGDLPETLDQLIRNGDIVEIRVDANNYVLKIDDD